MTGGAGWWEDSEDLQSSGQLTSDNARSVKFPSGLAATLTVGGPVITVNWKAESNERWTVPLGLGAGMVFPIGGQYINLQIAAFYNVVKPTGTADWTIRPQIQILFPH